jgi:hypothetical protein
MSIKCISCKKKINHPSANEDLMHCPFCNAITPTGFEGAIRKIQEAYKNNKRWPGAAVGRAIGLAAGIYRYATHGDQINYDLIERKVQLKGAGHPAGEYGFKYEMGRHGAGVNDESVGLMFVPVRGMTASAHQSGQQPWHVLYVVFRGSRGGQQSEQGSRIWYKPWKRNEAENPLGAGWGKRDDGEAINVDWRSNFNTAQVVTPWASPGKIHRGFLDIYSSVRDAVHLVVKSFVSQFPKGQVVTCGHSLGAGLSVVCAHDLESSDICHPFCFPFCCPRAGDLQFARHFNANIADRTEALDCEFDKANYNRSFVFVQSNDPVSWGGEHGFKEEMGERAASWVADSGNIAVQGIYAFAKFSAPTNIYYHVGNLFRASYFGMHDFGKMEKELLG